MFNIFLRTAILYVVALFVIRVMGKGELSKMDPFQLVALFMIAELAALPIATPNVAVITGVAAMIGLLLIQVVVSVLSIKSPGFNRIVKGRASLIIEKGKLNEREMRKFRVTVDDLSQQLRIKNYPSIADVEYAILEANGDLSVIPKPEKSTLTRKDIGVPTGIESLPMVLIADGVLIKENLLLSNITEENLKSRLSAEGIDDYSKVFLSFLDENEIIYVHPKSEQSDSQVVTTQDSQGNIVQKNEKRESEIQ